MITREEFEIWANRHASREVTMRAAEDARSQMLDLLWPFVEVTKSIMFTSAEGSEKHNWCEELLNYLEEITKN